MPAERDKVHQLEEKRSLDRMLAALDTHEEQLAAPMTQLVLEADGEVVASFEPGAADVSLRLPRRARSLTVRDESETVRGFTLLDEEDLDVWELDQGRVALRFRRDDDGSIHVAVSSDALASPSADQRAAGSMGGLHAAAAEPRVVEAAPASGLAVATRDRGGQSGWSRYLAVATVALLIGGGIGTYRWYQDYQETQTRIAAQQAAQERQQQELERLRRANEETDRRVAKLIHQLKSADSEAERARLQAELESERAKAAAAGKLIRGGRPASGGDRAKAACKPGDPLCSDM